MKKIKLSTIRLFVAAFLLCLANLVQARNDQPINLNAPNEDVISKWNRVLANTTQIPNAPTIPFYQAQTKFAFADEPLVNVADIEQLYTAVNNPGNAGSQIVLAPGVYMLSATGPGGTPRPNGGRLELQENMSLRGITYHRDLVVIDAMNLTAVSGSIVIGKGSNSIEWLTIRNNVNGSAGISTIIFPGTAFIRIAHIISTGNRRGIDIANSGAAAAGRRIEAEIVDNDLYNNLVGLGEGMRIVNFGGANGGSIVVRMSGNRSYGNKQGLLVVNNRSNNANISVFSSGDRFYENGAGAIIFGALSSNSTPANGNTVTFESRGSDFVDNRGAADFDRGGVVIGGGENISIPNGTSNNRVSVNLINCRLANNQIGDLIAFGARSDPITIGLPGTNNIVHVLLHGVNEKSMVELFTNSIPVYPGGMNFVSVIRY